MVNKSAAGADISEGQILGGDDAKRGDP